MKNIVVCTLVNAVKAVMCIAKSYDCTSIFWWRDIILLMYVCFNQQLFCNNILISYRDCTYTHTHTLLYVEAWPCKFIQVFVISLLFGTIVFLLHFLWVNFI